MLGHLFRRIAGAALGLPKATRRIKVEKDIVIPMRDGIATLANRHHPIGEEPAATVLMRSPYGRGTLMGFSASLLAERGLNVIVQSVRGTAGSEGAFDPVRQERDDGVDTLKWVRAQPWFGGKLFALGGSYLGTVVWAMGCDAGDQIDGAALTMTLSNFRDELLEFGGFTQGTMLGWTQMMQALVGPNAAKMPGRTSKIDRAHDHLPLGDVDRVVMGKTVPWWQDWISHADAVDDDWWRAMDYSAGVTAIRAPIFLIAGWGDLFLPHQLKDLEARQRAGLETWITIGPWTHGGPGGLFEGQKLGIAFLSALAAGDKPFADRGRVRLYVQGADEWREYPSWPPPNAKPLRLHLRAQNRLDPVAATEDEGAARYVYDPADPTPSIFGPALGGVGKSRDMSALERRADAVAFSTGPLDTDLDIVGPLSVELSIRSDREHTDFYACLCDVGPGGRPLHVADGYIRLRPGAPQPDAAGVRRITIDCWPTAYRFARGHRLRLILASGAHPRYARNLGVGEPLATATEMVTAQQEILLGPEYGSSVSLSQV